MKLNGMRKIGLHLLHQIIGLYLDISSSSIDHVFEYSNDLSDISNAHFPVLSPHSTKSQFNREAIQFISPRVISHVTSTYDLLRSYSAIGHSFHTIDRYI